jgi:hypothetical protein
MNLATFSLLSENRFCTIALTGGQKTGSGGQTIFESAGVASATRQNSKKL